MNKDLWKNRDFKVMLLKETDKPFNSKDFIYEIKFDGIRALIFAGKNEFRIVSRNGINVTNIFPELTSIKKLCKKNVIFDGEIVSMEKGKISFSKLSKRMHLKNKNNIMKESTINPVTFVAFDIIYENKNITTVELLERKKILNKYKDTEFFVKSVCYKDGIKLFDKVKKLGIEGVVAKYIHGEYHINERTDDFIKIKNFKYGDFFIGGYLENKNGLSLLLGEYSNSNFIFVGKVSLNKKYSLYERILKLRKSKNYFCNLSDDAFYVKPSIKCKVQYLEKTENNSLRQPILKERD